jgi:hypothetical protein
VPGVAARPDGRKFNSGTVGLGSRAAPKVKTKQYWLHKLDENDGSVPETVADLPEKDKERVRHQLYKWRRPPIAAGIRAARKNQVRIPVPGSKRIGRQPKFPALEQKITKMRQEKNARGIKVTERWLVCQMKRELRTMRDPETGELLDPDGTFCGSHGYFMNVVKRTNMSARRASNNRRRSIRDVIPLIWRFLRWMRYTVLPVRDSAGKPIVKGHPAFDSLTAVEVQWGRFLKRNRFNVDQIPMPFCGRMRTTWTDKGIEKVWLRVPGSGQQKRMCTGQVPRHAVTLGHPTVPCHSR